MDNTGLSFFATCLEIICLQLYLDVQFGSLILEVHILFILLTIKKEAN